MTNIENIAGVIIQVKPEGTKEYPLNHMERPQMEEYIDPKNPKAKSVAKSPDNYANPGGYKP